MKNLSLLLLLCASVSLSSCEAEKKGDDPKPDEPTNSKLTLTTDWTARTAGIGIPAQYTAEMVEPAGKVTLSGTTVDYPTLLTPGIHTLNLYNTTEGVTIVGNVATVAAEGAGVKAMVGFQFWGSLTSTTQAGTDYTDTVVMKQITRQLEFDLTLDQADLNRFQSAEALLDGVAGAWDCKTNKPHGAATSVVVAFTRTDNHILSMVRLLGVDGEKQNFTLTLTFNNGQKRQVVVDMTAQLATFNANKVAIAALTGNIEAPSLLEYNGNVNNWTGRDEDVTGSEPQPTMR